MANPTTLLPWRRHATEILRIGLPLVGNNLAIAAMGTVDTLMAGQLGSRSLAAVAVGVAWYNLFLFGGLGVMMAVSPLVAHARGASRHDEVKLYARQGLWLALALAVVLVPLMFCVGPALRLIGIAPEVVPEAAGFVHAMAAGYPAMLAYLALRYTSEGLGHTRPILLTALGGLVMNIIGNRIFMFGLYGVPAMGAVGCGVASALVMWTLLGLMAWQMQTRPALRRHRFFSGRIAPDLARLGEMLRLGLPIAGTMLSESGLFIACALIMGTLGAVQVAAHQVALNFASLTFMVPLALHSATMVHVGHLLGARHGVEARRAGFAGIGLCTGLMAISCVFLILLNHGIAALYTQDAAVLELAARLLLFAGIFQISDGLQVGAMGALRGFKDARVPLVLCLFAYWVVGFPMAWGLGIHAGLGPEYVWVGLIGGLAVCAVLLLWRYARISGPGAMAGSAVEQESRT
jgi:multidrug resistance protein, MATE family